MVSRSTDVACLDTARPGGPRPLGGRPSSRSPPSPRSPPVSPVATSPPVAAGPVCSAPSDHLGGRRQRRAITVGRLVDRHLAAHRVDPARGRAATGGNPDGSRPAVVCQPRGQQAESEIARRPRSWLRPMQQEALAQQEAVTSREAVPQPEAVAQQEAVASREAVPQPEAVARRRPGWTQEALVTCGHARHRP